MAHLTSPRSFTKIQAIFQALLLMGMAASPAFATSSIQLTWEASPDPDLLGYHVYMGTSPGSYPTIKDAGLTQSFLFQNLADGKSYYFMVTAYDQMRNESMPSDEVSVEIPDTTAPSIPGNVSLSSSSNTEVSIQWTPSTDNVGVTAYDVARDGVGIGLSQTTAFIDRAITAGSTYLYTVNAVDAQGNVSAWSTPLEVSVALQDTTPPSVPQNLTLNSASDTQVAFSWTASTDNVGVSSYEVARDGLVMGLSQTTYFIDSTITPGTTYLYTVKAVDAMGNASAWSAPLEIVVASNDTSPPSVPQSLTLNSASDTQVAFSWTASTDNVGVTAYDVARDTVIIGQSTTTAFVDGTTSPGKTYQYTVKAQDAKGNTSAWSSPLQVTTPQAMTQLTVSTNGNGAITSTPNGINCPKQNCTDTYPPGTVVTLTATPGKGWSFDGWSGGCTGTDLCSVSLNNNLTITANFSKGSQSGSGSGGGSGGGGGGKGRNK